MIIFWKLAHNDTIKNGWCHNAPLENAIEAILYQCSITKTELKKECSIVEFRYRNAIHLGKYYFESDEFYPSEEYDNNPNLANL